MLSLLTVKKVKDLDSGDHLVTLASDYQPGAPPRPPIIEPDGTPDQVRIVAIGSTMWDDGDLYLYGEPDCEGAALFQLRGEELYNEVLVIA